MHLSCFLQRLGAAAGATIAAQLLGCASLSLEDHARRLESMLSAAGFHMVLADSEEKRDQIRDLPQLSVNYVTDKQGKLQYWAADADFCQCMYVGDESAYQKYQDLKLQEEFTRQQQRAAEQQMEAARQIQWGTIYGGGFAFH